MEYVLILIYNVSHSFIHLKMKSFDLVWNSLLYKYIKSPQSGLSANSEGMMHFMSTTNTVNEKIDSKGTRTVQS
jgi:hypothetical protein